MSPFGISSAFLVAPKKYQVTGTRNVPIKQIPPLIPTPQLWLDADNDINPLHFFYSFQIIIKYMGGTKKY